MKIFLFTTILSASCLLLRLEQVSSFQRPNNNSQPPPPPPSKRKVSSSSQTTTEHRFHQYYGFGLPDPTRRSSSTLGSAATTSLPITHCEESSASTSNNNGNGKSSASAVTIRQRLRKMGLNVLFSYCFVNNMLSSTSTSIAWYAFSKMTGLSPLAAGQWRPFLAVFAGFSAFNRVLQPLVLAASMAVSTYFDKSVSFIERHTTLSKSSATAAVGLAGNAIISLAVFIIGITLASTASGIPVFPSSKSML